MSEFQRSPDLDMRSWPFVMFEVSLRDGPLAIAASAEEFRAAILLRLAAWHQVPAGTLPNDDDILANLTGFRGNFDGFLKIKKGALQEFSVGVDGRLHHQILQQRAIELVTKWNKDKNRTAAATAARLARKQLFNGNEDRNDNRDESGNVDRLTDRDNHQQKRTQNNRTQQQFGSRTGASRLTPKIRIQMDTPQWQAWNRYLAQNKRPSLPNDKEFGWYCESEWPPGHPPAGTGRNN